MGDLSKDEFLTHIGYLREDIAGVNRDIAGVNRRLDRLNSKTEQHGRDIAVLKAENSRDGKARAGGFLGSVLGGAALIWSAFKG